MNTKEKKALLARMVELSVYLGEDITDMITRPLSYYDWDKVKAIVERKEFEYENQ